MRSPLSPPAPLWRRLAGNSTALGVSVGFHILLGLYLLKDRVTEEQVEQWVEMAIIELPPPPEPEPEPEPESEPEPVKRKPLPIEEPVDFKETVDEAPPDQPPPDKPRPRRIVQGMSASSFAKGAGTGLTANAGTSLGVAQTQEKMEINDAKEWTSLPFASVTVRPKLRNAPPVQVPQEAIDEGIEGTWTMTLTISAKGRVSDLKIPQAIGYGIDAACRNAWLASRWKPGEKDGTPVAVTGLPYKCQIKAMD